MDLHHLIRRRLTNQWIQTADSKQPEQVAAWLGALQAQEYRQAKWATGLRGRDLTEDDVERAIAQGRLVRTWLNRGTLHLAAASDVRWMLALLSPGIIASTARRSRQLELDESDYAQGLTILKEILGGRRQLTRSEIMDALRRKGLSPEGQRGYHILRRAGLEGQICFGPNEGNQQTLVLLDEWVEPSPSFSKEEALAELAGRYFQSHGPATAADFIWWSGLPAAEARQGLALIVQSIDHEVVGGVDYYGGGMVSAAALDAPAAAFLLPGYDEYFLGYTERGPVLGPGYNKDLIARGGVFYPMLVIGGLVKGSWKAEVKQDRILITVDTFEPLVKAEEKQLAAAAEQYSAYLQRPVELA